MGVKRVRRDDGKKVRVHAHANPLADRALDLPGAPCELQLDIPAHDARSNPVRFVDVGCGFGGMTVALAAEFPDTVVLGVEIRATVVDDVQRRLHELRERADGHHYRNAGVLKSNIMRYSCNLFAGGQVEKFFFLFQDPHFKRSKQRWRTISPALLSEYAFVMRPGGHVYVVTDVPDLFEWEVACLAEHPLFERLSQEDAEADPCYQLSTTATEESQKVARQGRSMQGAVFVRRPNPEW